MRCEACGARRARRRRARRRGTFSRPRSYFPLIALSGPPFPSAAFLCSTISEEPTRMEPFEVTRPGPSPGVCRSLLSSAGASLRSMQRAHPAIWLDMATNAPGHALPPPRRGGKRAVKRSVRLLTLYICPSERQILHSDGCRWVLRRRKHASNYPDGSGRKSPERWQRSSRQRPRQIQGA